MILPNPPGTYLQAYFAPVLQQIARLLSSSYQKGDDIVISRTYNSSGTQTGEQRLVLQSPNGTYYKITVDNSGTVTTTSVPKDELL